MEIQIKNSVFSVLTLAILFFSLPVTTFARDGSYVSDGLSNLDAINDWNHSDNNPFNNSLDLFPTNSYSTPMYSSNSNGRCCNDGGFSNFGLRYSYNISQYPAGYGATILQAGPSLPRFAVSLNSYPGGTGATTTSAGAPVPGFSVHTQSYPAGSGASNIGAGQRVPGFTSGYTSGGSNNNNNYSGAPVPGYVSNMSQSGNQNNNNYYYSAPVPRYKSNFQTSGGMNTITTYNGAYNSNYNSNNTGGFVITGSGNNTGPGSFVITTSR